MTSDEKMKEWEKEWVTQNNWDLKHIGHWFFVGEKEPPTLREILVAREVEGDCPELFVAYFYEADENLEIAQWRAFHNLNDGFNKIEMHRDVISSDRWSPILPPPEM